MSDLLTADPYTIETRLCDDEGMVSHERKEGGNIFNPDLTYYQQLNNLRAHSDHPPYDGEPFVCTGHAHLAGHHIRCTSPVHPGNFLIQPERWYQHE